MFPNIYIKRVKPSINKMKAADLKALGFKTKAIAKTFAKLSDVTAKNYNKKDIDDIIKKLTSADLIEQFMKQRADSRWKFYKFLDVKFHVYEMNTPIGKANELPKHFKEGSNEKALIKYEIRLTIKIDVRNVLFLLF